MATMTTRTTATTTAPAASMCPGRSAALDGEPRAVTAPRAARRGVSSRAVLAASGFVMLGYVLLHLSGNLLAFAGGDAFNAYARSLRELGAPLVGAGVLLGLGRVLLAGALAAHLAAHLQIMRQGAAACPSAVRSAAPRGGGKCPSAPFVPTPPPYAAYPLPIFRASGGAILLFVVFHLAQLTFGATHPAFDPAA